MLYKKIITAFLSCTAVLSFAQNTVKFTAGATLSCTNNAIITLENINLENDGTIDLSSGDGVFRFSGTGQNTISGSGILILDKLEIAKTGNAKLLLNRNMDVIGSVNFVSGLIDLNTKVLSLHSTGVLQGENENSRIVGVDGGFVHRIQILNAPAAINPGNLGATITSSQNLGSTIIRRGHQSQTNGSGLGNSILRFYDIIPANNTALNATLRFQYFDAELNSLNESSLEVWKSSDNMNWISRGFTGRDVTTNYVDKTGLSDFSRQTLSSPNNPLPLVWGTFNVKCNDNTTRITWETLQESNTQSFIVQRSNNGTAWTNVAVQSAAGQSHSTLQYSYTDLQTGNLFYRIIQTDLDGRSTFSPVLHSNCTDKNYFKVYPNPVFQNKVQVAVYANAGNKVMFTVYDNKGALVKQQQAKLQAGMNFLPVDLSLLAAGLYNLVIEMPDGKKEIVKLVKQ
jgi:hypothetical protein